MSEAKVYVIHENLRMDINILVKWLEEVRSPL